MTCELFVRAGHLPKAAALPCVVKDLKPEFTWVEPTPRLSQQGARGPRAGFCGITRGLPHPANLLPINELRLFWQNATLHYVAASNGGLRFAAFATNKEALPNVESSRQEVLKGLTERSQKIIWRQDLERFLGPMAARINWPVRARLFGQGARLVAWWLVEDKGS